MPKRHRRRPGQTFKASSARTPNSQLPSEPDSQEAASPAASEILAAKLPGASLANADVRSDVSSFPERTEVPGSTIPVYTLTLDATHAPAVGESEKVEGDFVETPS